jgi:hypothetical protein
MFFDRKFPLYQPRRGLRRAAYVTLALMQLSQVFVSLGEDVFGQLLRQISIGKLKTYQLYETFKARAHTAKLNTESLRKGAPRFWARLSGGDEELAKDLAQAVLVSHLDLIRAVLDFLAIPNQDGFFQKDIDAQPFLTEGWQQRVWEKFQGSYPESVLRLYINHLAWELAKEPQVFVP